MKRGRQRRFVVRKLGHDTFRINRRRLLDAMGEFDRQYRASEPISGTKFAVFYKGKSYPPKRILGLAIGRPASAFSGGEFTNDVFSKLGFGVGPAPSKPIRPAIRHDGPVPPVGKVVSRLFSEKWKKLATLGKALPAGDFPGVYVISYSDEDMEGRRVLEGDVYYVGMSNHAGLRSRLSQFLQGLEDGGHHSAAKRFFTKKAHRTPYSRLEPRGRFFFACVPVPCVTVKRERRPQDLKKMGVVAAAEMYALARIRNKTNREPELNEQ